MNIDIQRAKAEEKPVLRKMLELYAYDFSEIDKDDLNDHGEFGYGYLDYYWLESVAQQNNTAGPKLPQTPGCSIF
jgi:hypothetical protein